MSFAQIYSKDQLIFLLDRIVAENKPALTQLITLKQRLLKLVINDRENNKRLILIGLKKHFESLYYYNRPLLKELPVGQFDDLTLGECYQGVYSNAIMLMDRIIARGGINSYLLSGKRELIQQQAFRFRNFKKMILAAMFRRMLNSGQYCCGHYRI
ncbi:hypothetical protein [Piscirickettsia salmonis]|uniref:hypothetical protein n=1 Tax=Piscirickettsia salmonis TaxID=1238 RepID=UPI0012BB00F0|nr:hypothetical protein [Piscirickettsia salmonis]QGP58723.1 hypothetical protein PsalBI1_01303 [Piscirickettsia salmonis]